MGGGFLGNGGDWALFFLKKKGVFARRWEGSWRTSREARGILEMLYRHEAAF